MNQPDFGNELVKIRKAKGLTQSELAEKCEVSYRTIQRIESGKVTPRSFTIKTLSIALDFDFLKEFPIDSFKNEMNEPQRFILSKRIISQTIDLFNLKTNAMKKLSVLTIIFGLIGIGLFSILNKSIAQENPQPTNFLTIESNEAISQKDAIKIIGEVYRKAKYHNQPIDVIKTYAKKSNCNYDTYVHLAKLISSFGQSTKPAMEIANIVFLTQEDCDLFNEIASLIFLGTGVHNNIYVGLAKKASEARTEDERNNIRNEVEKYKGQAKFNSLDEAFINQ